MQVNKLINWLLFFILSIIWGSSFILMKHSKEELTASQIAALRIFSAAAVFLPLALFHIKRVPSKKIFIIILSGITGNLVPAFLFALAISKNIDSSLAAILNSSLLSFMFLLQLRFFGIRSRSKRLLELSSDLPVSRFYSFCRRGSALKISNLLYLFFSLQSCTE